MPTDIADPNVRRQMIADADDDQLQKLLGVAYSTMDSLLKQTPPGAMAHPDYADLGTFVGEIEAKQRKRATRQKEQLNSEAAPIESREEMTGQIFGNFDKVRIKATKQEGVIVETRGANGVPTLYSVQIGSDATKRSWQKPEDLELIGKATQSSAEPGYRQE